MINLEDCGIVKEDILNGVINEVSERLYDEVHREVIREIKTNVNATVKERVETAIDNEITSLLQLPIQKVDLWGDKIGRPQTLKEIIEESFKNWWTTKVNNQGRPTDSYGTTMTRAQYFVKKQAENVIDGQLRIDFERMVQGAKNELKKALTSQISEIVKRAFK